MWCASSVSVPASSSRKASLFTGPVSDVCKFALYFIQFSTASLTIISLTMVGQFCEHHIHQLYSLFTFSFPIPPSQMAHQQQPLPQTFTHLVGNEKNIRPSLLPIIELRKGKPGNQLPGSFNLLISEKQNQVCVYIFPLFTPSLWVMFSQDSGNIKDLSKVTAKVADKWTDDRIEFSVSDMSYFFNYKDIPEKEKKPIIYKSLFLL